MDLATEDPSMPVSRDDQRLSSVTDHIPGDWPETVILPDPHVDNLMSALMHMGAEHWTLRRRMLVIEKFLDEGRIVDRVQIDAYMPDPAERTAWDAERDAFIDRVFGVLLRQSSPTAGHGRFTHDG